MNILNIVDSVDKVNFGIWSAALSTSRVLSQAFGTSTFLYSTGDKFEKGTHVVHASSVSTKASWLRLCTFIDEHRLLSSNTVVATHGCWSFPTRFARALRTRGYPWIACPQGMLEPWSLRQKQLRKVIYFRFVERPSLRRANIIRAVATPEYTSLLTLFPQNQIQVIPNGICISSMNRQCTFSDRFPRRLLFLGRLHEKKCPFELAKAFCTSPLANSSDYELVIAGPDQGEGHKIQQIIDETETRNATLLEPVYGQEKQMLFDSATYFCLPSHSEGFPTAVLEAMGSGCIPLISDGCNIPEAANIRIDSGTTVESIRISLSYIAQFDETQISGLRTASVRFVHDAYTTDVIAKMQYSVCKQLLSGRK